LPQAKQLPGQRGSRLQVSPDAVEGLEPTDHHEALRTVADALGQVERTSIDVADLRCGEALHLRQRPAESDLHLELVERPRLGAGRARELPERGPEMRRGFGERVAQHGLLAGAPMMAEGAGVIPGASEVAGQGDGELGRARAVRGLEPLAGSLVESSPQAL